MHFTPFSFFRLSKNSHSWLLLLLIGVFLYQNKLAAISTNSVIDRYLMEIIDYQRDALDTKNYSISDYYELTKPFAIWDTRPRQVEEIQFMKKTLSARGVPNLVWGYIGMRVSMNKKEVLAASEIFLRDALKQKSNCIRNGLNNKNQILQLADQIAQGNKNIYFSDPNFQQVNGIFRDRKNYWEYNLPKDSPFPMSPQQIFRPHFRYEQSEEEILKKMEQLNFLAATKTKGYVVFIVDGRFDNSFGYIVGSPQPELTALGHLFNLNLMEKLDENFYYYFSN